MAKRKQVISHYDFVRDLRRGARGEDIVEDFFQEKFGIIAENVSDRNPDFDLCISELVPKKAKKTPAASKKALKRIFRDAFGIKRRDFVTVEVKYDEAAARYKNFFIEMFFNHDDGTPGTTFKCKADLIVWVVPLRGKNKIYIFKRPEFLAWILDFVISSPKRLKYKTPGISPYARGIPIPIKDVASSYACLGVFEYKS
jgi:hypothetical protein